MEDLIRIIVQAIVDSPQEVRVSQVRTENIAMYEIRVARSDTGQVIGKKGRTAEALRTIVNAASSKYRQRSMIQILE